MPVAVADVVILRWSVPAPSQDRPQKIVSFLGLQATCIVLATAGLDDAESISKMVPRCTCLIADAETLAHAAEVMRGGASRLHALTTDVAEHVFVDGFQPTERHDAVLRTLSSGSIRAVRPLCGHAEFQVADDHREWCGQFSGLAFGATNPAIDRHFVDGGGEPRHEALVRAGDGPCFVRATLGRCQLFLSACAELADLDEKVGRQARVLSWFSRLVPLMMFLRGA